MKSKLLWTIQILLALLFLWAGGFKLAIPGPALEKQAHMPALFLKFIGVCEILGGLGLVLPGAFKRREELTPLAASGLVIIMIGATVTTVMQGLGAAALFPAVTGILCATVAYARWRRPAVAATA
jgi:uncharacterized membrane protein YphA (DoxX/SURF4 family)